MKQNSQLYLRIHTGDQFDQARMAAGGLRLANASGVNMNVVSDHAMALMLGLMRQLHVARDNQRKHHWRGMISTTLASARTS